MKAYLVNMMNEETCIIYFSLNAQITKSIPRKELKYYLNCKFWSASRREALLFSAHYRCSAQHDDMFRIIAILTERLLKKADLDRAYQQIYRAVDNYRFGDEKKKKRFFRKLQPLKKLLDGINKDQQYPKDHLIDDVLNWCQEKRIIDKERIKVIRKYISNTRKSIFMDKKLYCPDKKNEILEILCRQHAIILLTDAKELLFPKIEIFPALQSAVAENEITAYHSISKDTYFFDIRSLIKWLIKNKILSIKTESSLYFLVIESVKKNKKNYSGELNSLKKLLSQGADRNNLLSQALQNKIIIFLKYPRPYLHYLTTGIQAHTRSRIYNSYFACQRYNGLGQLKLEKSADSFHCAFGGLTVDMLLYGEKPLNIASEMVCKIELIQTREEAETGLQPYVQVPIKEIDQIISDENLIVVIPGDVDKSLVLTRSKELDDEQLILHSSIKDKIWEETADKLGILVESKQKGRMMEIVDRAIIEILNAISRLDPSFDPMVMPGSVKDFYKFCQRLPYGKNIFAFSKDVFRKYCKRTLTRNKEKQTPLCAWTNPPQANDEFWAKISPQSKILACNISTY